VWYTSHLFLDSTKEMGKTTRSPSSITPQRVDNLWKPQEISSHSLDGQLAGSLFAARFTRRVCANGRGPQNSLHEV